MKNDSSNFENFCLFLWWQKKGNNSNYYEVDELPDCESSRETTKYNWDLAAGKGDSAISFPLVK